MFFGGKLTNHVAIFIFEAALPSPGFYPRSRDFLKQLGFFLDFHLKKSISGFFLDFSEREVRSLEMDFFVKLTRNKQFC